MLLLKGGDFEEFLCLGYFTILLFPSLLHVCSYVGLMPSVKNFNVNSHENESKDIEVKV